MEAILSDLLELWFAGEKPLAVIDQASITLVRERVRELGQRQQLASSVLDPVLIAATELAQNQLNHVGQGQFLVRAIARAGVPGLELVAADRGQGIASPARALGGGTTQPAGLGAGLGAVSRLMDELDIDVRGGEGTCIWARKFGALLPKRRQVGIFGRPHPHESVSGDHAAFWRDDGGLLLAVADGLGHGPEARAAADVALRGLAVTPHRELDALLLERHAALRATRGAVVALVKLDNTPAQLTAANVGNVSIALWGPGVSKRLGGTSFTLGAAGVTPRLRVEQASLRTWDALVMFTDGVSSRAQLEAGSDLLLEHPIVIAEAVLTRFGVQHDDVLVAVAR